MSTRYYRNVQTEEVVVIGEGELDVCKDVMVEETTNPLYREISAVEAGVEPEGAVEVASAPFVEEPVVEQE